ncbi:MAG: hypothetical protein RR846_00830 [Oscillospiraceae bacterium]
MYTMKPIKEYDVIELLNNGRFDGDLQGYVLSDGGDLFGYSLFKVVQDETILLDSKTPDTRLLDGIIRASVALGEAQGAEFFSFNLDHEPFKEYKRVFFNEQDGKIKNTLLFSGCKHG